MNFLLSFIRGPRAPYLAGAIALFYLIAIGFRGFGQSSLTWIERARSLALEISEASESLELSAIDHGLIDILGAGIYLLAPGWAEWILFGFSVAAGALSTALVFYLSQRLAGAIGGWVSLFFLLTCAPWMGLFTRVDPSFVFIPTLLVAIVVWHHGEIRWWARVLIGAPLLAAGMLLWPGYLIVLGLLVALELLAPVASRPAEQPGLTDGPRVSLDRILIALGALALLSLYPLFWPNPMDNLVAYFLSFLELPPAEFVFRYDAYPDGRPPFFFGIAWAFEQLPLALVGAVSVGLVWSLLDINGPQRRLVLSCAVIGLALLALPVIFRQPRPFGADFTGLFLAVAIPLASMATCRFFAHALGRNAPSTKVRQVAIAAFVLAGISVLIEVPRSMESPETFRSPMTARIVGWTASGDMPLRERILPRRVIDASGADRTHRLYSGDWEPYIDAYQRMRLLKDIDVTRDIDSADIAIRPVPAVAADRFSAYRAGHTRALPNSETELITDIHHPHFFIDRVVRDQD